MENNPRNRNEDHIESNDQDLVPQSPMRKALKDTVLGLFLETKEPRYFVSFLFYLAAFSLFAGVVFYALMAFKTGSIMGNDNHAFFGKLFKLVCWISGCVTAASLFAGRYAMGFRAFVLTAGLIFLAFHRP
jgi:hypothetical protein